MAIESGIGATISIDDGSGSAQALGAYCTGITITVNRQEQDISAITQSAMRRLLLRADAVVSATFVFEDTSNLTFDVFKTAGTYDSARTVAFAHSGQTLSMEMNLQSMGMSLGNDGSLTIPVNMTLASGTDPTWS